MNYLVTTTNASVYGAYSRKEPRLITTEFEAFQTWRKSRMNFWQLLAEGFIPSFSADLDELEEFSGEWDSHNPIVHNPLAPESKSA